MQVDKFKFINRNRRDDGSLNSAAQRIIDEYSTTAVNPYAERMQRFKESPGGIEAFKERFPNPLVKAARGLGKFFEEGTFLGKVLSSLKPSDKSCDITYISYIEDKELQIIYSVLGIELWRGVGSDDLLDPNYKYSKKKDRLE